jgi:pimeloyl-ACP methyl ester carboxylesterase
LILTHGWPGSVLEFHKMIDALSTPHGPAGVAFDVVIPSLPGYGFSSRPARPIGPRRVAALWATLMTEVLGYRKFVAQGGDWGCAVTTWLGCDFPDSLLAIHQNLCVTPMVGEPADEEERGWRESYRKVQSAESAYMMQHMTKPQTIGIALSDSPLGFAAWVLEKFHRWGDTHGNIESRFSKDDLITNLLLYLATDTVTSSIWLYHGAVLEMTSGAQAAPAVRCPTALALFPAEFLPWPPRRTIERFYNVQRWTKMAAGGHFAALEEPDLLIEDLRQFCAGLGG